MVGPERENLTMTSDTIRAVTVHTNIHGLVLQFGKKEP